MGPVIDVTIATVSTSAHVQDSSGLKDAPCVHEAALQSSGPSPAIVPEAPVGEGQYRSPILPDFSS